MNVAGPIALFGARIMSRVPLTLSQSLGAGVGWLANLTNTYHRRVAKANIAACFPELSARERRALRRRVMLDSGRLLTEMPAVWFRSQQYWQKRLDASEFNSVVTKIRAQGKGLIIALPHFGNWELGIHGFSSVGGFTALYRPPRHASLEQSLRKCRERSGVRMASTGYSGLRALYRELEDGGTVVILPDQTPADDQMGAVYAPFFGLPALTGTLLPQLARRTGSPVVFACIERRSSGRFTVRCFEADSAIASADPLAAATALNAGVERCARFCCHQYQWTYKRFKRQPRGVRSIYRRLPDSKPLMVTRVAGEAELSD